MIEEMGMEALILYEAPLELSGSMAASHEVESREQMILQNINCIR